MREVLIIRFGALGDLALATVLLDALRDDPVRITWATKERWASILRDDDRIDELVTLGDGESVRSLAARLDRRFDLVLDAHANLRSRMLCALVDAREVRRIRKDTFARWLYRHGAPLPSALDRRLLDRYLALVDPAPDARPRLVTPPTERDRAHVVVAVGAAHATKRWPEERFTELIQTLHAAGRRVTVVGGPGEEELVQAAAGSSGECWDPRRPLAELATHLASAAVFVGNDSGLLHLAEAVGTPVVGLFGPTVRAWGYYPWREESRVLDHELSCRPCSKMGEKPCRLPEKICLTRTSVQDVMNALGETLHATT